MQFQWTKKAASLKRDAKPSRQRMTQFKSVDRDIGNAFDARLKTTTPSSRRPEDSPDTYIHPSRPRPTGFWQELRKYLAK